MNRSIDTYWLISRTQTRAGRYLTKNFGMGEILIRPLDRLEIKRLLWLVATGATVSAPLAAHRYKLA